MSSQPPLGTRVVVLGEAGVGKTCFTDQFLSGRHFVRYDPITDDPFPAEGSLRRTFEVDGQTWSIHMEDLSTTPLREHDPGFRIDIFERSLGYADGIILLYDVTCKQSYDHIVREGFDRACHSRNAKDSNGACQPYPAGGQRFGCVLVGNKVDKIGSTKREVRKELAAEWATMQGFRAYELDTYHSDSIEAVMIALVRSIEKARRRDNEDLGIVDEPRKGKEESQADQGEHSAEVNKKHRTGLSSSFQRLRNALPHARSKSKTTSK